MNFKMLTILMIFISALAGCTNPFGGNSLINMGSGAVEIDWSNKDFDFGNQQIGSSSLKTFYISNNGSSDATDCGPVTISDTVNFSIVSQTCHAATLTSGSQCAVVVESHPQSAGEKNLVIDRQCKVKSNVVSLTNQVRVTAVVPTAHWNPMNHDFGLIQTYQSTFTKKFLLSNSGTSAITNCGLVSLSNSTDFSIVGDTCGVNNLGTSSTCEITVVGHPSSAGIKRTTLNRTCESNFTFSTTTDQIAVEGFDSFLGLYPATIDLGDVYEGQTVTGGNYIQNNTMDTVASCSLATLTDSTHFSLSYDGCGTYGLTPWDGCSLSVNSLASAPVGEHFTTLVKTCTMNDSSVKTLTVPVRVNVHTPTPIMYVFNSSHNYGDLYVGGTGSDNPFYFYNGGVLAASGCGQPTLDNTTDFSIVTNNCNGADIAPQSMCDVTVKALPQSTGNKTANLSMTCAVGGTVTATLQQNGLTPAPQLGVSPTNFNFGNINLSTDSDYTFTFTNQGPLAGSSCTAATLSNTTDFSILNDTCSTNDLAGGDSCTMTVRANTSTAGTKTTTLTRTCAVGGSVASSISAVGFVPAPNLAWSQQTHDFGSVEIGSSSSATQFYLTNYNATLPASGCSPPTLSNNIDFEIVSDSSCQSYDLSTNGWCSIYVVGKPQTAGVRTTHITRTCSVGGTVSTQTNGVTVTGKLSADLVQKSSMTTFGEVRANGGSSQDLVYYFRNKNAEALTGCTLATLSNPNDFTITYDDCATNDMIAATACEIRVKANPQSQSVVSGTLTRSCSETGSTSVSLAATGVNPALPESLSSYDGGFCSILTDKTVKCWGNNQNAQLGIGSTAYNPFPVTVDNLSNVKSMAGGYNTNCALLNDGSLKCWGAYGQGYSPTLVPEFGNDVLSIAVGNFMQCALMSDRTVKCWGDSQGYGLGDGINSSAVAATAVTVAGLSDVSGVTIGTLFACASIGAGPDAGRVKCWGNGSDGRLGQGSQASSTTPVFASGVTGATKVVAGNSHACALINDGTVKCWGSNYSGTSGVDPNNNTVLAITTPQTVAGLSGVVDVHAKSSAHTCASLNNGAVKCWGSNSYQQLSASSVLKYSHTPLEIPEFQNAKSVALQSSGTCVIDTQDKVKCTNKDLAGYLNETSRMSLPTLVKNIPGASSVQLGQLHGCAVINDGTAKCWGNNEYGQLGDGTLNSNDTGLSDVAGLTHVSKIVPSQVYTCALIGSGPELGKVKCWGSNWSGAIGNGMQGWGYKVTTPTDVINGTDMVDLVTADYGYCGLVNNGSVRCWGYNGYGHLGDGTTIDSLQAQVVPGLSGVAKIAARGGAICALMIDKTVQCWGGSVLSPTPVAGLTDVTEIAVGASHKCVVLTDKTVKCWGGNTWGQSGPNGSATPVTVPNVSNVIQILAGAFNSCAIMTDGTSKCWGMNNTGETGNGTMVPGGNYGQPDPQYRLNEDASAELIMSHVGNDARICSFNSTTGNLLCTGYGSGTIFAPLIINPVFLREPSGL